MRFVVTVMVRDEVDIIAAMVEHHLAPGRRPDHRDRQRLGRRHDGGPAAVRRPRRARAPPRPGVSQAAASVVTAMARRAFTDIHADWVINADADEFWVPCDKRLTLRSALEAIPTCPSGRSRSRSRTLSGPRRSGGSGVDRLLWRDCGRPNSSMPSGSSPNRRTMPCIAATRRSSVSQGNHFVSLKSTGQPDDLRSRSRSSTCRGGRGSNTNDGSSTPGGPTRPTPTCVRARTTTSWPTTGGISPVDCATRSWSAFRSRRTWPATTPMAPLSHETWLRDHLHGLVDRRAAAQISSLAALTPRRTSRSTPTSTNATPTIGSLFVALERERDDARKLADAPQAELPGSPGRSAAASRGERQARSSAVLRGGKPRR